MHANNPRYGEAKTGTWLLRNTLQVVFRLLYVYTHVHMHLNTHYAHTHAHTAYTHPCMLARMYTECVHKHACTHIMCPHTHMHTCIHLYICIEYIYIYIHSHKCKCTHRVYTHTCTKCMTKAASFAGSLNVILKNKPTDQKISCLGKVKSPPSPFSLFYSLNLLVSENLKNSTQNSTVGGRGQPSGRSLPATQQSAPTWHAAWHN